MGIKNEIIDQFKASTPEEWTQLFLKETKQTELNPKQSIFGFEFRPFYHASKNSLPLSAKENNWNINRRFNLDEQSNLFIHQSLNNGVSSITLVGDILSAEQLQKILNGVEANYIELNLEEKINPLKAAQAYHSYCTIAGHDTQKVFGYIKNDFISQILLQGGWNENKNTDIENFIACTKFTTKNFKHLDSISVDARPYHYAGANLIQIIGATLSHIVEYITLLQEEGLAIEEILDRLIVQWPVGIHYFGEIAAIRALKNGFNQIAKHITNSEKDFELNIHAEVSCNFWSIADINNNMLRATTQAMSAIIGGVNSLTVHPYNGVSKTNDEFASRIAANVQLLLREESYLNQSNDPAAGSYYVEDLTNQLTEKSITFFQEIEQKGGLIACIESEFLQNSIETNFKSLSSELIDGKIKILGLNLFPDKNEDKSKLQTSPIFETTIPKKEFKNLPQIRLASLVE